MNDQPDAETSTWQHTTHNRSKRAAADPHLRPCSHWDWQRERILPYISYTL